MLCVADVANSIGSFCAALYVYNNLTVPPSNSDVYQWVLALGGVGIVIGLATYGERVQATRPMPVRLPAVLTLCSPVCLIQQPDRRLELSWLNV